MLNFFKNKKTKESTSMHKGTLLTLKIDGMHCGSCSANIDAELTDLNGVVQANTDFQKQESRVRFDSSQISKEEIEKTIENLGYKVR